MIDWSIYEDADVVKKLYVSFLPSTCNRQEQATGESTLPVTKETLLLDSISWGTDECYYISQGTPKSTDKLGHNKLVSNFEENAASFSNSMR